MVVWIEFYKETAWLIFIGVMMKLIAVINAARNNNTHFLLHFHVLTFLHVQIKKKLTKKKNKKTDYSKVIYTFKIGKVWQAKTKTSASNDDDFTATRDDDEWKDWNEALANATEEELVDLAGMI